MAIAPSATTSAINFAFIIIQWLPLAIRGAKEFIESFQWGLTMVKKFVEEKRNPTDAEWGELNKMTEELRLLLHTD